MHGLFGHPRKSWSCNVAVNGNSRQAKDSSSEASDENRPETKPRAKKRNRTRELFRDVFWPHDLLPKEFPRARIITWGYDVEIGQPLTASSQASLLCHAQNLLSDIAMLRTSEGETQRPLLFIAHSLGGIVVKDALSLLGNEKMLSDEVLPSTIGVIFLGTPHHGSESATLGKIAFETSRLIWKKPNMQILRSLERDSEVLERISKSFGYLLANGRIKVHSFREELPSKGMMIVGSASSAIGYLHETQGSLHANHRNMAKFSSTQDTNFQRLVSVMRGWINVYLQEQKSQTRVQQTNNVPQLPDGAVFDEELRLCLKSLYSVTAKSRYREIEPAFQKTYEWLFDHKVGLEDWLEGKDTSNIYWIRGKPGSGKSTIMKFAIIHHRMSELLKKYNDGPWIIAGHFFHDRGAMSQKSAVGFLRHLLHQILDQRRELFALIQPIYADLLGHYITSDLENNEWTFNELEDALTLIAQKSTTAVNVCLLVDALDEHSGDHRALISILVGLARLPENPLFKTRLLLAGRPENVFKSAFRTCPGFHIHEYTFDDIRHYTEKRVQAEIRCGLTKNGEEALTRLTESIVQKAQGVFLWVRLVVDEVIEGLCEGDTVEELEIFLLDLPTELEDLYIRALRRPLRSSSYVSARNKYETYIMFHILSAALDPFPLRVFLAAVEFLATGKEIEPRLQNLSRDQLERRLYSRSAGLLETSKDNEGHVQFIHQTTKEFILSNKSLEVLCEGLDPDGLKDGFSLILKFIIKLFECAINSTLEKDLEEFLHDAWQPHALAVEQKQQRCFADLLPLAFISAPAQVQIQFLTRISFRRVFHDELVETFANKYKETPSIQL